MNNFSKIVMPGSILYGEDEEPVHIAIKYIKGRLSLSGVVGAMRNGDCVGSAGQCKDVLKDPELKLADGWNPEMVAKLYEFWERWHLNDMRAECEHQRALGWKEKAKEKVKIYKWTITIEVYKEIRKAEAEAREAMKNGKPFIPTARQTFLVNLKSEIVTHKSHLEEEIAPYYECKKPSWHGGGEDSEIKTLGRVTEAEHPDGILSRPCPVCGYKYGHAWKNEDVPQDVLEWLATLPKAEEQCAWRSL